VQPVLQLTEQRAFGATAWQHACHAVWLDQLVQTIGLVIGDADKSQTDPMGERTDSMLMDRKHGVDSLR
jgi:hypothetical protein